MPDRRYRDAWTFADGPQGWGPLMGVADFRAEDGVLAFTTTSRDPAIAIRLERTRAERYRKAVVRMKVAGANGRAGDLQLFWTLTVGIPTEATSVRTPLIADGAFHDYELPVGDNRRWSGRIYSLRLDPGSVKGLAVTIDSIFLK
jgi:hypothetical protein